MASPDLSRQPQGLGRTAGPSPPYWPQTSQPYWGRPTVWGPDGQLMEQTFYNVQLDVLAVLVRGFYANKMVLLGYYKG